jgi:hypothetical protein
MCPEFSFPLAKSHSEREIKQSYNVPPKSHYVEHQIRFVLFCFVWQNEWETQRGVTCYDVMQNPFPFSL